MKPVAAASSRSFFNDGMSVFVTKIVVLGLSIFSAALQARALGPADRGILAMLLVYPQLLTSIAEGGMRQATVYYVGRKTISEARILGASIVYTLVSCALFSSLIFFMLQSSKQYSYTFVMMAAAALILPVNLLMNAIHGMLLGKQHIRQFNTSQWLQKLLLVLAYAVLFLFDRLTVETAIVCMLLCSMAGFVPALYFFFREIYTHTEFDKQTLWRMVKKGSVYAAALFMIEANYKLDILLLGWLSTEEEVGLYTVATNVGELLWQLPAAIGVVVFSRSANDRGTPRWHAELARSVRISLWVTLVGALALSVLSPLLFNLVFGRDFGRSSEMMLWLLPGLVLMVVFKLLNLDLAGKGKPFISLSIMLPMLIVSVGVNYLLIPSFGGIGAAITSSVCYLLASVAMLMIYARMYKVDFIDFVLIRADDVRLMTSKIISKFPVRREA